eukprot:gene23522-biopygen7302
MAAPQAPPGSKNEGIAAPQALPGLRTCKSTTLCSVLACSRTARLGQTPPAFKCYMQEEYAFVLFQTLPPPPPGTASRTRIHTLRATLNPPEGQVKSARKDVLFGLNLLGSASDLLQQEVPGNGGGFPVERCLSEDPGGSLGKMNHGHVPSWTSSSFYGEHGAPMPVKGIWEPHPETRGSKRWIPGVLFFADRPPDAFFLGLHTMQLLLRRRPCEPRTAPGASCSREKRPRARARAAR